MIYPQKNKFIRWFFHNYILRIVGRDFQDVKFNSIEIDGSKSILLLANHFSWWDGFLMYYINHKLLKKNFHVMVIEETMQKVSFFKYLGAFSVSKGSKGIIASLDYAAELLNDPKNMVLIFPQGELHSNFVDEVKFEKGLSRIIEKAGRKYQTVLSVTFVENFEHKMPTANVYLKDIAQQNSGDTVINLQQAYQQHYDDTRRQQTQITV
ncbi:glycerol acyltransferase [Mucilaginibacter conchicola]|uniref:Glycerol acyltransferase n=1 Tax=Mucilaginibacter conchicola TaxID=2303333 RepID=A0A372NR46_9SPHI|nr:lysophospholipid acyltransferase family protein [Mucilaginibacter conchicola]RFZ91753.1 glycerol acyltransferase [Mucilaginibacter conchicola]